MCRPYLIKHRVQFKNRVLVLQTLNKNIEGYTKLLEFLFNPRI